MRGLAVALAVLSCAEICSAVSTKESQELIEQLQSLTELQRSGVLSMSEFDGLKLVYLDQLKAALTTTDGVPKAFKSGSVVPSPQPQRSPKVFNDRIDRTGNVARGRRRASASGGVTTSQRIYDITAIREAILTDYDPSVPAMNATVSIDIDVQALDVIDIAEGSMGLRVWVNYLWQDPRLVWDEASYGGEDRVWMNTPEMDREVWVPDVTLYNQAELFSETLENEPLEVYSNGEVWWGRPGKMMVSCEFDVSERQHQPQPETQPQRR